MVRKSARSRKVMDYSNDVYKDIDSDSAPHPLENVSSSDEFELPESGPSNAPDSDPAAGGDDSAVGSERSDLEETFSDSGLESEDSSGDDDDDDERPKSRAKSFGAPITPLARRFQSPERTPGSAPSVHRRHVRTVDTGKGKGRRRHRLIAEGASPTALRVPDQAVRITYRPGFTKATGKKDRLVQVYGVAEDAMEKAALVRDKWISAPAVPEKAQMAVSPFWEENGEEVVDLGEGMQKVENIQFQETSGYLLPEGPPLRCVLGPVSRYEKVVFKRFGIYDLKKVGEGKKGFLLNAGGQVLSMDWATNRAEGCQYLAMSTTEGEPTSEREHEDPPAFARQSSRSTIQIWRFPVDAETAAPTKKPSIALMLCHDWGPARNLKWCPVRQNYNDPKVLGYLAAIYSDGSARVLKVILPEDYETAEISEGCDFLKFTAPAFECTLPDDICTAVSWISNTSVVVSCASGFVATWDLLLPVPIPYLYTPLHQTYITALSTCFPSFPAHIVTSSMDGYSRLTSLASLDASTDTVLNNRSRIAPSVITYVDALQSAISVEEGTWVKFFPLRRYFSSTTVCKHIGIVRAVAASVVHPFILSGGTEGEAVFSNPTRRVFHGKIKNYQQTWFQLEYSEVGGGAMRMTEGFKLEECEGKAKIKGGQQLLTTVFPMQVGIGAVCWNGNLPFGGWATAASSSGLVRVEDVAI